MSLRKTEGPRSAYGEKLRDPRWQKLRLQVFGRDGFACQECADESSTLNVHHLWYEGENPWDAPLQALVTLCENCHEYETQAIRLAIKDISDVLRHRGFGSLAIFTLARGLEALPSDGFQKAPIWASVYAWAMADPKMRLEILNRNGEIPIGEWADWNFAGFETYHSRVAAPSA
jgi:hypothetical protein